MDLAIGLCDAQDEASDNFPPLPGVAVRRVSGFSDNILWRAQAEGGDAPSTASDYICLAAITAEGLARAQQMTAAVAAATGIELPVVDLVELTKPNRRKLLGDVCVRALAERAAGAEARVGQLAGALAVLRREHEAVLEQFVELEAMAIARDEQPIREVRSQKTVSGFAELGDGAALGRMASVDLPFTTEGLFSLAFFIDAKQAEGALDIRIETRGTSRALAAWTIELGGEDPDWRTVTRPVGFTQAHSAARLVLVFKGSGKVKIGVGPAHPSTRAWLVGGNGQTEPRQLALRALSTAPGLRIPDLTHSGEGPRLTRLWDLPKAEQASPDPEEYPTLVGEAVEGGTFAVPAGSMTTAARLGAVVPAGATAIMASAVVAHPEGPAVDFGLAAGDPETIRDLALSDAIDEYEGFSGWVTGQALRPVLVSLVLPQTATGTEDLFLVTRISPEASHDWCARAVFRTIRALIEQEA